MANQLDPMDIKQIISLHRDGLSNREVSSLLGISRNTINILKNNMDQMDTEAQINFESHIPIHQNLRVQSYYH